MRSRHPARRPYSDRLIQLVLAPAILEIPQVGSPCPTHRKVAVVELEGIGHRAGLVACLTANVDVGSLPGHTHLQELKLVGMVRWSTVDEVDPREVVEVPVFASDDEAGGDGGGQLAGIPAVLVDVPHPVGSVGVGLQLELVAAQWSQPPTAGAEHPPRKRRDRDADVGLLLERVQAIRVGDDRRRSEGIDLSPEGAADRRQQPSSVISR